MVVALEERFQSNETAHNEKVDETAIILLPFRVRFGEESEKHRQQTWDQREQRNVRAASDQSNCQQVAWQENSVGVGCHFGLPELPDSDVKCKPIFAQKDGDSGVENEHPKHRTDGWHIDLVSAAEMDLSTEHEAHELDDGCLNQQFAASFEAFGELLNSQFRWLLAMLMFIVLFTSFVIIFDVIFIVIFFAIFFVLVFIFIVVFIFILIIVLVFIRLILIIFIFIVIVIVISIIFIVILIIFFVILIVSVNVLFWIAILFMMAIVIIFLNSIVILILILIFLLILIDIYILILIYIFILIFTVLIIVITIHVSVILIIIIAILIVIIIYYWIAFKYF